MIKRKCTIEGCESKYRSKGYCSAHYQRFRNNGDPGPVGKIEGPKGAKGTSEYSTWSAMKQRCNNPNNPDYSDYGGRGISVYPEWENSFETFLKYIGPKPSSRYSIDRINNNGNYEPGNVRWASPDEQAVNKRSPKNKAGYPGVSVAKNGKSYEAYIYNEHGTQIHLGTFPRAIDAAKKHNEAKRLKLFTLGVVGFKGGMASKHFRKISDNYPTLDIQGYDVHENLATTSIDNCDALIVATPSSTHYEIAKTAIENNQHVLIEKPVTLNYKQAQTLYRLSREYNVVFMTGHNYGFNPDYRRALPELYHATDIDFKLFVQHDNIIENATFDLAIHGIEICFNLGQRDFSRDFELLDCAHDGSVMVFKARIGSKNCTITAGYDNQFDIRQIMGFDPWGAPVVTVDFHDADGKSPDAMENLHNAFIKACNAGVWQPYAENAVAAVQLAEQVQECLFPGVDPVV